MDTHWVSIGEDRTSPWLEAIAGIRSDHAWVLCNMVEKTDDL
jgi:hypothetical protein